MKIALMFCAYILIMTIISTELSYQIAKRLDLSENISHFENTNYPVAIKDVNLPLSNIINAIKQQLNLSQMRTNILNEDINNKIINNIAIFAGSGSISEINKVSSDYRLNHNLAVMYKWK
nr:Nif3-like dinuclear metal center hexameric protein [Mycoplasmopsis bovis]